MACIIELQGYCTKEHGFVPKEVFITSKKHESYYLIKPIQPYSIFPLQDKKNH